MALQPGGHVTPHTGSEIDAAILRGQLLRIVNNGFIKLESSELNPINLDKLKNSGNFTTNYYSNGPKVDGVKRFSPLNLTIILISNELYQFAKAGPYTFMRKFDAELEAFGSWSIDQTAGAINPGPYPPASPVDGKTVWLDSSNPAAPTLKIFINNEWVELLPATAMIETVYDPNGLKTDIYAYIDDAVKKLAEGGFDATEIKEHIENSIIHVSQEEKSKWDNAASLTNLSEAMSELRENVSAAIKAAVSGDMSKIDAVFEEIKNLEETIDSHIANSDIHPSEEKQAEWNSKVDNTHTHILDGRVVIDVDHIDGTIPETMIPYTVSERVHQVHSIEEMLKLKAPAHNGDVVCIAGDSYIVDDYEFGIGDEDDAVLIFEDGTPYALQTLEPTIAMIWYFIIDDTKLDSLEGYLRFSSDNVSFDELQGKPNTLAGYGITDATPKSEFDEYNKKLDELEGVDTSGLQVLQRKYNRLMANRAVIDLIKTDGGVAPDIGSGSTLRIELAVQHTKTLDLRFIAIPKAMDNYLITWKSDNESVATVDADGILTGVAVGTCNIAGYCEEFGFNVIIGIEVGDAVYSLFALDSKTGDILIDNDQVPIVFDERSE